MSSNTSEPIPNRDSRPLIVAVSIREPAQNLLPWPVSLTTYLEIKSSRNVLNKAILTPSSPRTMKTNDQSNHDKMVKRSAAILKTFSKEQKVMLSAISPANKDTLNNFDIIDASLRDWLPSIR
jgi:hypothetical protein